MRMHTLVQQACDCICLLGLFSYVLQPTAQANNSRAFVAGWEQYLVLRLENVAVPLRVRHYQVGRTPSSLLWSDFYSGSLWELYVGMSVCWWFVLIVSVWCQQGLSVP